MKIIITKLHPEAVIPKYQTLHSAGMDLVACMKDPKTLAPLERAVIPTGIAIALPDGYEAQVRARSGLAAKHGIGLSNGVGTIDADYRGEVGVLITNFGQEPFVVEPGMRIAQMVVARYERAELELVEELPVSDRGVGGFGSTGTR